MIVHRGTLAAVLGTPAVIVVAPTATVRIAAVMIVLVRRHLLHTIKFVIDS
jgi:hypothetical protein